MRRRIFLGAAGTGLLAGGVAVPAHAEERADIRWRLVSSFPANLDILHGGVRAIAEQVSILTEGRFQIRVFAAGEIVPGLQVLDTVQSGAVELGYSGSYYYFGKNPAFAFDTAIPFGFNARQQNAWMQHGGGRELMREVFAGHNILPIPAGNTGAQTGGWYRREINGLEDVKGMKLRIGGLGGQIMARLGAVPQQIAASDVYPALERGTIDAAEWVGPYDDEKLGLQRVAKYYYTPGWWEGCAQLTLYVNLDRWRTLPPHFKAALEIACAAANSLILARYDAENPQALRRLVANGAEIRFFPKALLEAAYGSAFALYDEIAQKDSGFRKIFDVWQKFRKDELIWFRSTEINYDNFVAARI